MVARRQLVRNGNSTQVCIPHAMLTVLKWNPSDPVLVYLTERGSVEIFREVIVDRAAPKLQPMMLDTTVPAALR